MDTLIARHIMDIDLKMSDELNEYIWFDKTVGEDLGDWSKVPFYSTDTLSACQVIGKLNREGDTISVKSSPFSRACRVTINSSTFEFVDRVPMAVCMAALYHRGIEIPNG